MSDEPEQPPGDVVRGPTSDRESAEAPAAQGADESFEEAAMFGVSDSLAAMPRALLDAKSVIEQQLAGAASRIPGAQAVSDVTDAGVIQGVGIGVGEAAADLGGGMPGSPVLTVFVAERASPSDVRAVVSSAMGARVDELEEVPIQVIETGLVDIQPHRFRVRPAPGGISVAHYKVTAGTAACECRGSSDPRIRRRMILSNNHVLANSNDADFGDPVCQPGPFDGGSIPEDQVGILERFVPINFDGSCNYVDCATAWCWPDRVRRELVYLSNGTPTFFKIDNTPVPPVLGAAVGKSGRTTQVTSGRIITVGVTVNVNYGGGRIARFCDQIAISAHSGNFSASGDSGSSIWTWEPARRPVGLLFAGGGGVTFANRMDRVLSALDITIDN